MIENIIVGTTKWNKCGINLTFYTWNIKNTGIVYFDFAARKFLIMKQNTFHSQSNFKLELVPIRYFGFPVYPVYFIPC